MHNLLADYGCFGVCECFWFRGPRGGLVVKKPGLRDCNARSQKND